MNDVCEWCLVNAGTTNVQRPCCQLRQVANSPAHIRQVHYQKVRLAQGYEAYVEFINKVNAERRRLRDLGRNK